MDASATPKVDVRDVIAERMGALARPIAALTKIAAANPDMIAAKECATFLAAWANAADAYAEYCEAILRAESIMAGQAMVTEVLGDGFNVAPVKAIQ